MPKLPDVATLGDRPTARPAGGLAQYRPVDEAALQAPGAAQQASGRALQAVGAQLGQTADQIYAQYKHEAERADTLRAEEAFTKLREQQLELTVGEQDGFSRLKGSAAVNRPLLKEYSTRFQDAQNRIEGELANDQQKEKFRARAGVAGLQFKEEILRHTVRESDVYAKEVFEGVVQTEIRNATANWEDSNAVAMSLERIRASVADRAERHSWPKEYATAVLQEQAAKIHTSVIGQAIANKRYDYAEAWYMAYRGEVDPNTAATLAKVVEDGTQKQLAVGYQSTYLASRDDPKALDVLEAQVMKDPKLDDQRKNSLVQTIKNRQDTLIKAEEMLAGKIDREMQRRERAADRAERRNELLQARRERQVQRVIDGFNADTMAGFPSVDTDRAMELIAATKGSPLEPEVRQAIALAQATSEFAKMPPWQQQQQLAKAEATIREDPRKFDRKILTAWQAITENQKAMLKDSPATYAVKQGMVNANSPAAQPLDVTNPAALGPQLTARMEVARGMRDHYGAPLKPLTRADEEHLGALVSTAKPEQKLDLFSRISKAMEKDKPGYMAVMGQIAKDDPVAAVAGSHAGSDRPAVAALILRGQAYLNPPKDKDGKPIGGKLVAMPPDAEFEREFARLTGTAFSGAQRSRSVHLQAVQAAYAGLAADKGGETALKQVDANLFGKAVEAVLGGITRHNGREVVRPYGMGQSDFEDGLKRRIVNLVDTGRIKEPMTADRLYDLPLLTRGDGRYALVAGDSVIHDKDGKEVVIDFTVSAPFRTSGTAPPEIQRPSTSRSSGGYRREGGDRPIDTSRPRIENEDGSYSTERTITIEADGKHYLIPTIVNGKQLSEDAAIKAWRGGKNKEVGVYGTAAAAEAAAVARSKRIPKERGER